jgi:hypothetical protein
MVSVSGWAHVFLTQLLPRPGHGLPPVQIDQVIGGKASRAVSDCSN